MLTLTLYAEPQSNHSLTIQENLNNARINSVKSTDSVKNKADVFNQTHINTLLHSLLLHPLESDDS